VYDEFLKMASWPEYLTNRTAPLSEQTGMDEELPDFQIVGRIQPA
jgi:hypothetical protein